MKKITVNEILQRINDVRQLTKPPEVGDTRTIGIDNIVAADAKLLYLQERLLDDYGSDPQSTEPESLLHLTKPESDMIFKLIHDSFFQGRIGAEDWSLTEPEEMTLWGLIKRTRK